MARRAGRAGHGPNITSFGSVALAPGLLADGVVVDPGKAAARALLGAPDFPRARRSRSVIALPAQRSIVRRIAVPSLIGKHFAELVDREVRREMPMLSDNAYVAWQPTGDRPDGTTNIFVAGVARDVLDSHLATARAAGLHPIALTCGIIAAARAFGAPDSIVASIEGGHLELVILREGVPDSIPLRRARTRRRRRGVGRPDHRRARPHAKVLPRLPSRRRPRSLAASDARRRLRGTRAARGAARRVDRPRCSDAGVAARVARRGRARAVRCEHRPGAEGRGRTHAPTQRPRRASSTSTCSRAACVPRVSPRLVSPPPR